MNNKLDAKKLLSKYLSKKATPQERILVEQWFITDLKQSNHNPDENRLMEANQKIWSALSKVIPVVEVSAKPVRLWPRITAVASLVLCLSFGVYFLFQRSLVPNHLAKVQFKDIPPGGNKAILTLADGKSIVLGDGEMVDVAVQAGVQISKRINGELAYEHGQREASATPVYNTLTIPRGGTYKLVLGDGTLVHLNALSSITFPVVFTEKERRVSVVGEAYFEVAPDRRKPFKVVSKGQTVEVLGTHFNVNSYADEPYVQTTLLEGKVLLSNNNGETLTLRPGQQANAAQHLTLVLDPDIEEATAWKDGFFHFNKADLPTVMRALSRWYDVDVEYRGKPTQRRFTGDIYRNLNVTKALQIISYLDIDFRIEGRKIIVLQ